MSVNVENMALWLAALESGNYVQGKTRLHDMEDNTWCCLGVACKVAVENGIDLERSANGDGAERFDGYVAYLPFKVQEWLGLDHGMCGNPIIAGRSAAWWNDAADLNFFGIAYLLRREYCDV